MGLNIGQVDPSVLQKLFYGGPQSMFAPPSEAPPTPQTDPSAPQRGSVAQAMQSAPPPQAQPTAPAPQSSQPGYSSTPPSFDEYHASHGDVPMAAPAPAPKHGMLAKIMLGVGEALGNPLATRIGERDRSLSQANQQFEQNKPALQYSTNRAAYEQDIGNMQKVAETRRANIDADLAQQNLPMQEEASKRFNELRDAWQNKAIPPEQFDTYANVQLSAMPPAIARMVHPHIADIKTLPQTGKGYKLNMQDDLPVSVEAYGKTYQPDAKGNFPPEVPPQAVQDFKAAQQAHGTKRGEKLQDEEKVAGYAAERQATSFSNQQTAEGRKAAQPHLADINDAKNQQEMMEKLLSGKMNPASQTAAMFKMIGLEQPTGTHRIMPAEVEGIEHLGGLSDRLKQKLMNWKEGDRFSPDLVPDVISTAKILSQSKIKTANDNLQSVYRNTGYKVPGTDANGRLAELDQQQGGGNQPKVATTQHVADYAQQKGITKQQAEKEFKDAGYTIQ